MKSIQISSPQTERKVACLASVAFMVAAWLLLAGFLVWAFIAAHPNWWGGKEWCIVLLGLLALLLIPFQLARYFREMRTGNLSTKGIFNSRQLARYFREMR